MITGSKASEILTSLYVNGYTQKQPREITGISERQQRRYKKEKFRPNKTSKKTEKNLNYLRDIESELGRNAETVPPDDFIDIKKKGNKSKAFKKYRKVKKFESKSKRKFSTISLTKDEINDCDDLPFDLLDGKYFYVTIQGEYLNEDKSALPFTYRSKAVKRQFLCDLIREMIENYGSSDRYQETVITFIQITGTN